ncbi:MAG: hypothetical protein LC539_10780 [Candidatus Thiodiazotropha sp.]|nr:hypothetical protein [Candidatus Thiodiazotropha sp.]
MRQTIQQVVHFIGTEDGRQPLGFVVALIGAYLSQWPFKDAREEKDLGIEGKSLGFPRNLAVYR